MIIDTKSKSRYSTLWCRFNVFFLAMIWCVGLSLGVIVVSSDGDTFSSLMRMTFKSHVSIVNLLSVIFVPFFLSIVSVLLSQTWLFLLISFVKSFCYAYTLHAIILGFGVAGWLIQIILMLTECISVLFLLWFWIRHISGERNLLTYDVAVCSCVLLVIAFAEYHFVSSFLETLI